MPGVEMGRDIDRNVTEEPDFCIVGSGAAGGVCALKLAQAGFSVVILEEGPDVPRAPDPDTPSHVRPTLIERESVMYRRLYQEAGGRLTTDSSIQLLQGRCLGGGTAVNWAACLPPPDWVMERWRDEFGAPVSPASLRPFIHEVVNYLEIHPNTRYNASACRMIRGAENLGYSYLNLPNNTRECRECGSCGTGCPYDRKLSGFVKWIPDALATGAVTVYTDAQAVDLVVQNRKVRIVEGRFLDGTTRRSPSRKKIRVKPRRGVVLAAGAIGTPGLLLAAQSLAENRPEPLQLSPLLGRRTHIHPITICFGRYPEPTFTAYGVPDNMYTDRFGDGPTGYLIETGSSFPVMTSILSFDLGGGLTDFMESYYPRQAVLYAHHTSGFNANQPYGTVRLDNHFRPELDYRLDPDNIPSMRESLVEMTKIHLAAGAEEVYHVTNPPLRIPTHNPIEALNDVEFALGKTSMLTVHVMGGCAFGDGVNRPSVVDPSFHVRGLDNAWVADGSLFPTGLGANPQVTIYALALEASQAICAELGVPFTLQHQTPRWPWPAPPEGDPCLAGAGGNP